MSFANLYSWNPFVENLQVQADSQTRGVIKRKKAETTLVTMVGMNTRSDSYFFVFRSMGRFLVGYEKEPKQGMEARFAIEVPAITAIGENFKDKKGHVQITLMEGELHLKFDDDKDQRKWISALNGLKDYYSRSGAQYKEVLDDIPTELQMTFSAETEIENWAAIKKLFDYTRFVQDKSLKPLLELPVDILRNRLLISQVIKSTKKRKDIVQNDSEDDKKTEEVEEPTSKGGGSSKDKFLLGGSPYYALMISQWPTFVMDQETYRKDTRILTDDGLKGCLKFNTLYFFDYKKEGDISEDKKICNMK